MNTGVSTAPCASSSRPARAAPSLCVTANRIAGFYLRAVDQHRIAVAEEAIARADRMPVGGADLLHPCERRDEHEQRRLGEMEVRDEAIDDAKAIARRDEEIGLAAPGGDVAVARGRLERSQARGPDRDHARPTLMRALDGGCGRRRELVSLAVHAVVGEALRTHGLKGAGPDVQGEEGELDAAAPERCEQRLVEVQPGGRRGDRTGRARIDGLIPPLVYGIGQVSDIRWEWHAAVTLE